MVAGLPSLLCCILDVCGKDGMYQKGAIYLTNKICLAFGLNYTLEIIQSKFGCSIFLLVGS